MKYLASANNLFTATLWQSMLESAGIRCHVRNRFIAGAMGEIPADQVAPQVWVDHDGDLERARTLLQELRHPTRGNGWRCHQCGEFHPGQFGQCWNCGTDRPEEEESGF